MGFLAPWYLVGAAAIVLPLWLHLLRQYKRTPQPFSSLMFFERRVQSSVKHRRLRTRLALRIANAFVCRRSKTSTLRTLTVRLAKAEAVRQGRM